MKKVDTTKEAEKVRESQHRYLDAGKKYSQLLVAASKLDPTVLKLTKDIHSLGNNLSVLDSRVITDFYNAVRKRSLVDPEYQRVAAELVRAKNSLDHARYQLFEAQVARAIKRTGLPIKKHNLSTIELAEIVNDPKTALLAKVAYATDYIKEEILELSTMAERGEVTLVTGDIIGKTREARNFLRNLNTKIVTRVNDKYFGEKHLDIKKAYVSFKTGELNLLSMLRELGDAEHVRELERRISSSDVKIKGNTIVAMTDKGSRYLKLLNEELGMIVEKGINSHLTSMSQEMVASEPLLSNILTLISEYEKKSARHSKLLDGNLRDTGYGELLTKYQGDIMGLTKSRDEIISDIDRLASAAIDVRKKLLVLSARQEIEVGEMLPVLTALRLLTNFEHQLDQKIDKLGDKLRLTKRPMSSTLPSITDIRENLSTNEDVNLDVDITQAIGTTIAKRRVVHDDFEAIVDRLIKSSKEYLRYREITTDLVALKNYLTRFLSQENRLYRGNETVETLLREIIELEIEREELLAEMVHKVQQAHKQIWLLKVHDENENYFDSQLGEQYEGAKNLNKTILHEIENDIVGLVDNYRNKHLAHKESFLTSLSKIQLRIEKGEDVSVVTRDLKQKYQEMILEHQQAIKELEEDMERLDRQMALLPEKTRKTIEKKLISDIQKKVQI